MCWYFLFFAVNLNTSLSCRYLLIKGYTGVFNDHHVSVNCKGFDPQIFLNDPKNLLFTFFNSYGGGHCDPLNKELRKNPGYIMSTIFDRFEKVLHMEW